MRLKGREEPEIELSLEIWQLQLQHAAKYGRVTFWLDPNDRVTDRPPWNHTEVEGICD